MDDLITKAVMTASLELIKKNNVKLLALIKEHREKTDQLILACVKLISWVDKGAMGHSPLCNYGDSDSNGRCNCGVADIRTALLNFKEKEDE